MTQRLSKVAAWIAPTMAVGVLLAGCQVSMRDEAGAAASSTETSAADASDNDSTQTPSSEVTASSRDWSAVAASVRPSVVDIRVNNGSGSGVIFDGEGRIVTNHHVVGSTTADVVVVTYDGRVFDDVKVLGTDPETDLAVLQIVSGAADLTPAMLGDSTKVQPGQPVMAVGSPLGLSSTVTTGIVSAVDRPVVEVNESRDRFTGNVSTERIITNAIQTDAAINHGNSGGALVNTDGAVIGINSSIVGLPSSSGMAGSIGLGFAIPIAEVKKVAQSLISTGTVEHAWIGVSLRDSAAKDGEQLRMATEVVEVAPDSPAAQAGLQAGDAIVEIDDEVVRNSDAVVAQIRERSPGDSLTMTVVRDGAATDVTLTVASNPQD